MAEIVVITGVGSGLGESLARKFVTEGCRVALLARSQGYLSALLFTGATSAVRGRAGALAFSSAKFALRGLADAPKLPCCQQRPTRFRMGGIDTLAGTKFT